MGISSIKDGTISLPKLVELSLEVKGENQSEKDGDKRVVAGDIKLPAEVEIANPNQTICHIDDPKYVLKMHVMLIL